MRSYYFAAQYARHGELRAYADELQATLPGARVTSRWIGPVLGDEDACSSAAMAADPVPAWKYASADLEDIEAAQTLVSFTGPVGRGGRHVEHGYAMALGKRIVIVGPRDNIFHCHPDTEVYGSWSDFLDAETSRD